MLNILFTFFTRRLIITEHSPSVSVPCCTCLVSLGLKTNVYVSYCSTQGTKVSVEVSSIFVSLNEHQKSTPKVHLHWQSLNHNCEAKMPAAAAWISMTCTYIGSLGILTTNRTTICIVLSNESRQVLQ
jgi:hypothetical protein